MTVRTLIRKLHIPETEKIYISQEISPIATLVVIGSRHSSTVNKKAMSRVKGFSHRNGCLQISL